MIDYSDAVGWPAKPTRVYQDSDPWLEELQSAQDRALAERKREAHRALRRRWYAEHREECRAYAREWRAKNPDKAAAYNAARPRKTTRRVKR